MGKKVAFKGLTATTLGFGAAAMLAPGTLLRTYGIAESTPDLRAMTRLWGSELITLGVMCLRTPDGDVEDLLLLLGAMSAISAGAAVYSAKDGVQMKTAAMSGATSAGLAAVAFRGRAAG